MKIDDIYHVFVAFDTNRPFQRLPKYSKNDLIMKSFFVTWFFFVVNSPYTKRHINGVCQKVYISVFKIKEFHLNFIAGPGLRSITQGPHKIWASNFAKLSIIDSWFYNYFIIKIYCKFDPCLIKTSMYLCFSFTRRYCIPVLFFSKLN